MPSGCVRVVCAAVSPMSLTLHTTEIWLDADTDSGGMKDRTHGIVLQKKVSGNTRKQTNRQTLKSEDSAFFIDFFQTKLEKIHSRRVEYVKKTRLI